MSTLFSIGTLSKAAGCKVETIRYYEKIGLMPEPPRTVAVHPSQPRAGLHPG
jgi:hypothetical protein